MTDPDPHLVFRFGLEISGIEEARFTECSGMQASTDVFEYKEGGLNGYVHKLPGRVSYSNITLKRGVTESNDLYEWYERVLKKKDKSAELKDISILQYDPLGNVKYRWNLMKAFPVKWSAPSFDSGNSQTAVETFELAFGDFELKRE